MRSIVSFAAIAAVSSLAVAQTVTLPTNKIRAWDRTTEFTTRGSNSGNAGHVSQAFTPGQVMGWSDISYIQYVIQDWDRSTVDPYDILYTPLDSVKGLPDYAKSTAIITNVRMQVGAKAVWAWLVTHSVGIPNSGLAKPFKLPASQQQWHLTWSLKDKPGAKWTASPQPTDGQSVHMSNAGPQLPGAGTGLMCVFVSGRRYHREIPRQELVKGSPVQIKEDLGWSSNPPGQTGPVDPAPINRSYRLDLGTTTPALAVASDNLVYNNKDKNSALFCFNPNEGYAGLDPDFNHNAATGTGRYDNPVWLIEAGSKNANGVAAVFWSQAILPKGIPIFTGTFFLDFTDILFGVGAQVVVLNTAGSGKLTMNLGPSVKNSPLRKAAAGLPNWHAQALILHAKAGNQWTNLATMRPMMAPGKFVAASSTKAIPADLSRPTGSSTFFIRNDGRGEVTVQTFVRTQHFPRFDIVVPERTSIRVRVFGAATNMKVVSKFTNKTNFHYMWNY